jgi:hypothetical protein
MRQAVILELLRAGFSTGYIQKACGAARSTIAYCRQRLKSEPPSPNSLAEMRPQIMQALANRALKGGQGSTAAANSVLRYLSEKPDNVSREGVCPACGRCGEELTVEEGVKLLREWKLIP